MRRQLAILVVLAVIVSGCSASRAFRRGEDAARRGDWDKAVTEFTKAVQDDPDNGEYKVHMRRSQEEASRLHLENAKNFERTDQLDLALAEYRKSLEFIGTDRIVQAKVAELERTIRERVEATRPKPRIDQLRADARAQGAPPLLNPANREPLRLNFGSQSSLRDIINFIGTASGINVNYDAQFVDRAYTVNLDGVTVEEALNQILSANQYYYKVTSPRSIIIIPDQPAKHQQYDELVLKVFYINHADATELASHINSIMRIPQMPVQPMVMPNKPANSITVRATQPVMDVFERLIKANDKPKAEVVLDVSILEVNRVRVKRYGINLSSYTLNLIFSPELAPPNTGAIGPPPPFNLNTISQGVSTSDFYLGVPTAVVNFLESDSSTRALAKPQLRGQEGKKMTMNLGQEIPVLSTVFGAPAAGGFATIPQSSYNYRTVGIVLDITPTVTFEGEIRLEISVESSSLGASIEVGGQSAPSFNSRKVTTNLRLREGEANLLAGLVRNDHQKAITGPTGVARVPFLRSIFAGNDIQDQDTDIVMLITPHIVRDQELTREDVGSIYIGTQQNVGISGPPQLIAPLPQQEPAPAGAPNPALGTPAAPNLAQPGAQQPPVAAPPGAQTTGQPVPAGTSPVPGSVPPGTVTAPPPGAAPAGATQPGAGAPAGANPPTVAAPPGAGAPPISTPPTTGTPPATPPRSPAAPPGTPPAPSGGAGQPATTTPAQIIITPPGTEFRVAGGPYTVPVSINNATRISTLTLTITYNPAVLSVRTATDGTFMRQGGVTAGFTPRRDPTAGRIDIAISRAADQTGASGAGLVAALMIDAVGAGTSTISVTGVAMTPDGTPVAITSSPVTVTVR